MELTGRVALVTGAASGIGRSIARAFADGGARVLVSDVMDTGHRVAEELGGSFLKADLSSMAEVRALTERATAAGERVDILVNNAGFQRVAPVEEFSEETWAQMIQVMLIAAFQLTRGVLPGMKERGWGRIINVSSVHGLVASPYKSAYVSAKHGLLGLTKTVALEAGGYGVTVNAICPAYVRTPLVEHQIADQARTRGISEAEVVEQVMLEPAAVKRLIEPEEVAALIVYLCSEAASAITGVAWEMDLGWTAR